MDKVLLAKMIDQSFRSRIAGSTTIISLPPELDNASTFLGLFLIIGSILLQGVQARRQRKLPSSSTRNQS